jgi:hypothetical protein
MSSVSWRTTRSPWAGRVALESAAIVAGVLLLKLLAERFDLEVLELSPLYSSIVTGGIFVIGLIIAGTLTDYKESEKMPAEISAALENILQDCRSMAQNAETFDEGRLRSALLAIVAAFRQDLSTPGSRTCLAAVDELSSSILELERLGAAPPYVMRLRAEQGSIRRAVLRIYHIQQVEFLPSTYLLIQTLVFLGIGTLVFTRLGSLPESLVALGFISYLLIYLVKLLKVIDRPFRVDERTPDDVSLFLLDEFAERLEAR